MQNGPNAQTPLPAAFMNQGQRRNYVRSETEEKLMSILYIFVSVLIMVFLGVNLKLKEKWITKNASQKNEFRLGSLCLIICVFCGIYAYYRTRNAPPKERAVRMKDENPVAAYTMAFTFLIVFICSFLLLTYLIGPFGIIFFGAFWVCFYNLILVF